MYDYYRSTEYLNKQFRDFLSGVTGRQALISKLDVLNDGLTDVCVIGVSVKEVSVEEAFIALQMFSYAESVDVSSTAYIEVDGKNNFLCEIGITKTCIRNIVSKLKLAERKTLKFALSKLLKGALA